MGPEYSNNNLGRSQIDLMISWRGPALGGAHPRRLRASLLQVVHPLLASLMQLVKLRKTVHARAFEANIPDLQLPWTATSSGRLIVERRRRAAVRPVVLVAVLVAPAAAAGRGRGARGWRASTGRLVLVLVLLRRVRQLAASAPAPDIRSWFLHGKCL
eukprot:scaffold41005_cov110-Phaeocystis_antarctica.AAC.4